MREPFIARDTREPLVVLGGYKIDAAGGILRESINLQQVADHGCDPLGNGQYRMVPSGDIVDAAERDRRLG